MEQLIQFSEVDAHKTSCLVFVLIGEYLRSINELLWLEYAKYVEAVR